MRKRLGRGARELGAASHACEIGEGQAVRERGKSARGRGKRRARDPAAWLQRGARWREGRGTGPARSRRRRGPRTGSGGEREKRSNAIPVVSMAFGARADSVSFLRNDFLLFLHLIDCHVIKLLMRC